MASFADIQHGINADIVGQKKPKIILAESMDGSMGAMIPNWYICEEVILYVLYQLLASKMLMVECALVISYLLPC
jgi:hypothetical protein